MPGRHRTFVVLGYGGNGITFSVLAARILRGGLITPEGDPDERLRDLTR